MSRIRIVSDTLSKGESPALLITGPTASGKSDLAIYLAEQMGAQIVNADSVQFYRGFDIGSAKPTGADQERVPHALIDCCGPGEGMDAAKFYDHYVRLAAAGRTANGFTNSLVVGSSGLYLSALLRGLSDLPAADHELRETMSGLSGPELWERLRQIDSDRAAQLAPHDRARIVRSLEVSLLSNSSYTEVLQGGGRDRVRSADVASTGSAGRCGIPALVVVLVWPREQLYARIEERTRKMFASGLVEEVQRLLEIYPQEHQALKAIGYKEVVAGLKAGASEEEMRTAVAQATRQYAKRQMTFWRNEPIKQGWACSPERPWVRLGRCLEARPLELSREQLLERVVEKFSSQQAQGGRSLEGPLVQELDGLPFKLSGGDGGGELCRPNRCQQGGATDSVIKKRGISEALSKTEVWYCSGYHVTN